MIARENLITTAIKIVTLAFIGMLMGMTLGPDLAERLNVYTEITGNIQVRLRLYQYLPIFLLAIAAIIIIPFLRSSVLRISLSLLVAFAFAADFAIRQILEEPLGTQLIQVFITSRAEAGFAFLEYWRELLLASIIAVIIALGFSLKPTKRTALRSLWVLLPLTAIGLTHWAMHKSRNYVQEFPAPISLPNALLIAATTLDANTGPRNGLSGFSPPKGGIKKIVLIVDESIRGDYLGLNEQRFDNTPFMSANADDFINFGIGASFTNCSATTRVALRVGMLNQEIPDDDRSVFRKPTFWQFGKEAGYKTVFLDGWRALRSWHSWFNKNEEAYVDERINPRVKPFATMDDRLSQLLIDRLQRDERQFIFVEKIGIHPPYFQNYPQNIGYEPGLGAVPNREISDKRIDKVKAYSKGILNRVDGFFKILIEKVDLKDTLIIYTSDHGQNMFQGRYRATHCSNTKKTHWGEGSVPMLVLTEDPQLRSRMLEAARLFHDQTFHEQIFPTLLALMGFDPDQIRNKYGSTLLEKPGDDRPWFFAGDIFSERHRKVTIPIDASPVGRPKPLSQ